ncbi:hypothetical protein A2671_01565 [Candidatus Kaiserbacteria bacterium RIFCSPHIGHO2_01_FULL_49_13]|uniref:Type II secretion system protein n=1 Tax=Candidatus Kaiserbacteria bacterium RIFCSPHIGHO2_01_FULL_49_13 TaxID=1798477 RepID=A0A1F6CDH2_9BACT|nr:MAG: hypothetical protein A2671_01565 [Candidatus Kaiserbacteria bacterium RIFCSPHIGHO2_01_FULL_49_13]
MSSLTAPSRGFTLIEALIYTALFSFIIGGAILAVYSILDGSARTDAALTRDADARFVLQKIAWVMNDASNIFSPTSGNDSESLSVVKSVAGTPTLITIDLTSGRIFMTRDVGPEIPLTSERVRAESILFHARPPSAGAPPAIEMSFVLNGVFYGTTTRYVR